MGFQSPKRPAPRTSPTIQIILKHFSDPDGRYTPRTLTCQDYIDGRGQKHAGCGATVQRFLTYPKEKAMRFDGDPVIVQQFPPRQDGMVIAVVETGNVHYATCPAKKAEAPPPVRDFKIAAGGSE